MWKTAFAGAMALAMVGSSLAKAEVRTPNHAVQVQEQGQLTHERISQFRAVLKLRPDQERYWAAVARVLHGMVRQAADNTQSGLIRRFGAQASAVASDAMGLRQLAAAAMPLVRSMDDEQKFAALQFVNAMGYGAVVAQF